MISSRLFTAIPEGVSNCPTPDPGVPNSEITVNSTPSGLAVRGKHSIAGKKRRRQIREKVANPAQRVLGMIKFLF